MEAQVTLRVQLLVVCKYESGRDAKSSMKIAEPALEEEKQRWKKCCSEKVGGLEED